MQAHTLGPAQNRVRNDQRRDIRVTSIRGLVGHAEIAGSGRMMDDHPSLGVLLRFGGDAISYRFPCRDLAEGVPELRQHRVGVEIADGNDERILRRVVAAIVAIQILSGDGEEVLLIPDDHVAIWVCLEGRSQHLLIEEVPGIVSAALTLREDDRPLRFRLLRVEQRLVHPV